jgi:hypothetical protein
LAAAPLTAMPHFRGGTKGPTGQLQGNDMMAWADWLENAERDRQGVDPKAGAVGRSSMTSSRLAASRRGRVAR